MRTLRLLTACALLLVPACARPRPHDTSLEPMRPYVTAPLAGARWSGDVPATPRTIVVPLARDGALAPVRAQPVARPPAPLRAAPAQAACPPACRPACRLPRLPCLPLQPCCPGGT